MFGCVCYTVVCFAASCAVLYCVVLCCAVPWCCRQRSALFLASRVCVTTTIASLHVSLVVVSLCVSVSSPQKNERREKIEQIVREREMRKLELSQKRWSRQEEASFLRVVAAFGVEYHRWVPPPAPRRLLAPAWGPEAPAGETRGCRADAGSASGNRAVVCAIRHL